MEKLMHELPHRSQRCSDVNLAHIYLEIDKSDEGLVVTELSEILVLSQKSISNGVRELTELGCITGDRVNLGGNRYPHNYVSTGHDCWYCTPKIKMI